MLRTASFRGARRRATYLGSDQSGQSLIELLIAAALTVVIVGAIGTLLITSQRQQQKNVNYDEAQASAQTELDAMVRQISDATNIVSWGPNSVDMDVNIGGTVYQVYYQCGISDGNEWNKCVRLQTTVGATLPALSSATTVIPYLSNGTTAAPVFSWQSEETAPAATTTSTTTAATPAMATAATATTTTATTATVAPVAPDYVTATIDVPAANGITASTLAINRTIVFSDGALIRNVDVEN